MSLLKSLALPLDTPIIPFSLPGTDGNTYSDTDFKDRKVLIIMFICNHCPYVKAVRDRLIDLQESYDNKEVQFIGINANDANNYPNDSPEAMKIAVEEFGINFPYLFDASQATAKAYQAQCTPDIYVFDDDRKLAYHGRIDDNPQEPDKVTKQELKQAIDALLAGERPSADQKPTMGCSIKWK